MQISTSALATTTSSKHPRVLTHGGPSTHPLEQWVSAVRMQAGSNHCNVCDWLSHCCRHTHTQAGRLSWLRISTRPLSSLSWMTARLLSLTPPMFEMSPSCASQARQHKWQGVREHDPYSLTENTLSQDRHSHSFFLFDHALVDSRSHLSRQAESNVLIPSCQERSQQQLPSKPS